MPASPLPPAAAPPPPLQLMSKGEEKPDRRAEEVGVALEKASERRHRGSRLYLTNGCKKTDGTAVLYPPAPPGSHGVWPLGPLAPSKYVPRGPCGSRPGRPGSPPRVHGMTGSRAREGPQLRGCTQAGSWHSQTSLCPEPAAAVLDTQQTPLPCFLGHRSMLPPSYSQPPWVTGLC